MAIETDDTNTLTYRRRQALENFDPDSGYDFGDWVYNDGTGDQGTPNNRMGYFFRNIFAGTSYAAPYPSW